MLAAMERKGATEGRPYRLRHYQAALNQCMKLMSEISRLTEEGESNAIN